MSSHPPESPGVEPADDGSLQPAEPPATRPGAQLLAARREQGLSLGDVARQLKLSVRQVEALERDEYQAFPGPVFVRGFLRNYAKLLQLDAEALVAQAGLTAAPSAGHVPSAAITPVPLRPSAGRRPRLGFGWLALGLVLVIVVLAAIYDAHNKPAPVSLAPVPAGPTAPAQSPQHADSPPPSPVATNAGPASTSPAPASTAPATDAAPAAAPAGVTAAPPAPAPAATSAAPAATAPAAAPTAPATSAATAPTAGATPPPTGNPAVAEVKLDFDAEAWVEIKDGTGAVIFARLNPAGVQQVVTGEPPLDVVVGNAHSVRLTYRNKPVDLGPHTRVDVARVRLE